MASEEHKKRKRRIKSHHLEKGAIFLMITLGIISVIILISSMKVTMSPSLDPALADQLKMIQLRQSGILLLNIIVLTAEFVQFIVLARIYEQHEK